MTRDQIIAAEYEAGLTMEAIGAIHGISRQRVHQIVSAYGVGGRPRVTRDETLARFWSRVSFGPGCWEWQGARFPTGYGHMSARLFEEGYAHRVSYKITHGSIPDGMFVLHRCDNPPCVRPDHLFAGTPLDNVRDRDAKGRGKHGPNAPSKKKAA